MRKGANLFVIFFITLLLLSIPFCFSMEVNLTYDGNGNLITGDGKYREYNEFNQLVRVRAGYSDAGRLLEEYVYHPTEERILAKNIYDFDENLVETVIYVNENFERKINESGTYDSVYVKDEEGNLIAEERLAIDEVLFYHNDHLGSTSVITNESGDAVETTFYEPYGDILEGGNETRYDYEGKEFSSLTEDYDFHFRKYDPGLSIFTQPDSGVQNVYDPQNLNRYSFERRNPYKYVDPDGHLADVFVDVGFIIYDIQELREDPNDPLNRLALVVDVAAAFLPFVTGVGLAVKSGAKGAKTVNEIGNVEKIFGETGKISKEAKEVLSKYGNTIMSYKDASALTKGYKGEIQAHHLIESRHLDSWGISSSNAPSIILSKQQHISITNKLRESLPYGQPGKTVKEVTRVYSQRVYKSSSKIMNKIKSFLSGTFRRKR